MRPGRELRSDLGRAVQIYRWGNSFLGKGSDLFKLTRVFRGRAGSRLHISFCSLLWFSPALTVTKSLPVIWGIPTPTLTMHLAPHEHQAHLPSQPEIGITCPDPSLALYSFLASSSTCLFSLLLTLLFFCLALPCGPNVWPYLLGYAFDSAPHLWLVYIPSPVQPGLRNGYCPLLANFCIDLTHIHCTCPLWKVLNLRDSAMKNT